MRSETNGCLQVQVPAKGGGFGANYVLTQVCNVSGLEKPQTQVCGRVSKVEQKRAPFRAFNLSHIPSSRAWMDLGTDYGVYPFSFSRSGITKDGITDDFLRVIVSGLFPCCASGRPGTTVKA